ncbi:hypothetical protein PIB30_003132 [Stylosanthes scabra]|uniref:Pentatricopeptide repeat-containing protein n=1 Tax=Stylosanthes scabra TaxID=79078 RepID=A0ABU6Y546_9FABA|nr:hypothetical protein [Stylosanthes scabra]
MATSLSLQLYTFPPNPTSPSSSSSPKTTFHFFNLKPPPQRKHHHPRNKKMKPFKEKDAFPSSLPIHTKNPRSIYRDIKLFARQDKLKEALTILDYVDQQGIPVNATTFSALIAACIRTKSLQHAREVHVHIRINGFENNEFLRTKLVHMYTSCGALEEAKQIFNELPCNSVYPWNALLRGSVISGKKHYLDVLKAYTEMRALGIELNVYTFTTVIKSFAGAPALFQGLKAHGLLIKNGFIDSSIIRTSLIDLYFKCGKINLACRVFDEIPNRDVVVWGAMVAGFVHNRLQREALEYVRWMVEEGVELNSVVVMSVLPAIGEVSEKRLGKEVHAYVVKTKEYYRRVPIQSALIDMYCKCGDMSLARRVFYSSAERNLVCWTALMSGYAWNVATVLPVCAQLRALKQGKEVHAYALKHWFLPNASITNSLMVMYSKCGVIEYSKRLFDTMDKRTVISWTAMIDSYVENGYHHEALDVIRLMQSSKHRPDSVAIARMLSVCGELKLVKHGKEIHAQLLKKDFAKVPFVSAELINMYGTFGEVNKAKLVFDAVPVKGSMTWTALIRAYGNNELYEDAIVLFDRMTSRGSTPTRFTFDAMLSILDRAGFVDEAYRIFKLMTRYKIEASKEHFDIMVRLFTRYGELEKAQRLKWMGSVV